MSFLNKLFGPGAASSIREGDTPAPSAAFRCVQINANAADCCDAARELAGVRFLPEEIPQLPLPDCDADSCECSYELFSDRRKVARHGAAMPFGFYRADS